MSKNIKKLEDNIESLEKEIIDIIMQNAERASETGEDLFTNSDYNPHNILSAHFHKLAEKLLKLARESLNLQEQASINPGDSIANLYLSACSESANLNNKQRRGPRKLAAWLHKEVSKHNAL